MIFLFAILFLALIALLLASRPVLAQTLYVDDDAPSGGDGSLEQPFETLQEALHDARDGDTIRVYEGVYYETVIVEYSVTLIGNGSKVTVLDGSQEEWDGTLMGISANDTMVTGFGFRNSRYSGIFVEGHNVTVSDNSFHNNRRAGIDIWNGPFEYWNDTVIRNNSFFNGGVNINMFLEEFWSGTLENNTVNGKPLIFLRDEHHRTITGDIGQLICHMCSNITVKGSVISNTTRALVFYNSEYCSVENVRITNTSWYGIEFINSRHGRVNRCSLDNFGSEGSGVLIQGSQHISIENCSIWGYSCGVRVKRGDDIRNYINMISPPSGELSTAIKIMNCTIGGMNCSVGIDVNFCGSVDVVSCSIYGNSRFGIENSVYSSTFPGLPYGSRINAVNNWWGHDRGPYHPRSNPQGLGDNVSDNVDFISWTGWERYFLKYVDADAPSGGNGSLEAPFNSIQEAVDSALNGSLIRVWAGEYNEQIVVNRTMSFQGNGSSDTFILRTRKGTGLSLEAPWVNVSGFSFLRTGPSDPWGDAGIKIRGDNCSIQDVLCSGASMGVSLVSSNNCFLKRVITTGNAYGIYLAGCSEVSISDCRAVDNNAGLYLVNSHHNLIESTNCSSNTDLGIYLEYCEWNLVENNDCFDNERFGIWLIGGFASSGPGNRNNTIRGNTCSGNGDSGICNAGFENTFVENSCDLNGEYGIYLSGAGALLEDNIYRHNEAAGVFLSTDQAVLRNNVFLGSGLHVASSLKDWLSVTVDGNNTLDGAPIHWWVEIENKTIPEGAGQIFLVSCKDIVVEDQVLGGAPFGVVLVGSSRIDIRRVSCGAGSYGFQLLDCQDCLLEDLTCLGGDIGVSVTGSTGVVVRNSSCLEVETGIEIINGNNNTLENNICEGGAGTGIKIHSTEDNHLTGNSCQNFRVGIAIYEAEYNLMEDNLCSQGEHGITLSKSGLNTLAKNRCFNNTYGIYFYSAKENLLSNNTCLGNEFGIYLLSHNTNNRLNGNDVLNNSESGIYLELSDNNIIGQGTCSGNREGIRLLGSEGNTLENNTIFGNECGISVATGGPKNNLIAYNNIFNNTNYGIENTGSTELVAITNWWGHDSGPFHPVNNPRGRGDNVSDGVEFRPWQGVHTGEDGDSGNGKTMVIVVVLGAGALLVTAVLLSEPFLFALFSLLCLLYTRLSGSKIEQDIAQQNIRGKVYQYIKDNPGVNFSAIRHEMEIGTGTTVYHLSVLLREGYLRAAAQGNRKLFWVKASFPGVGTTVLSDVQRKIVNILQKKGKISRSQLMEETGLPKTTLHNNLKVLVDKGVVKEEQTGTDHYCVLSEL